MAHTITPAKYYFFATSANGLFVEQYSLAALAVRALYTAFSEYTAMSLVKPKQPVAYRGVECPHL